MYPRDTSTNICRPITGLKLIRLTIFCSRHVGRARAKSRYPDTQYSRGIEFSFMQIKSRSLGYAKWHGGYPGCCYENSLLCYRGQKVYPQSHLCKIKKKANLLFNELCASYCRKSNHKPLLWLYNVLFSPVLGMFVQF